jgi:hypothetical protein
MSEVVMAFVMQNPAEVVAALYGRWHRDGCRGEPPSVPACWCAERMMADRDVLRGSTLYIAQCHGATDQIEVGWVGILAGPMALPLTAFVDAGGLR